MHSTLLQNLCNTPFVFIQKWSHKLHKISYVEDFSTLSHAIFHLTMCHENEGPKLPHYNSHHWELGYHMVISQTSPIAFGILNVKVTKWHGCICTCWRLTIRIINVLFKHAWSWRSHKCSNASLLKFFGPLAFRLLETFLLLLLMCTIDYVLYEQLGLDSSSPLSSLSLDLLVAISFLRRPRVAATAALLLLVAVLPSTHLLNRRNDTQKRLYRYPPEV